jgi:quinol-cytochrome oxidoreductase complex cytochrome b subunit
VTLYYIIVVVGLIVAAINFALGWAHRQKAVNALVRFAAGLIGVVLAVGVIVTKLIMNMHLQTAIAGVQPVYVIFIGAGIFIGATLMLPAYIEQNGAAEAHPSLQERAVRPVNATVRLQKNSDEWVN